MLFAAMEDRLKDLSVCLSEQTKEELLFLCRDLGRVDAKKSFLHNTCCLAARGKLTRAHLDAALKRLGRADLVPVAGDAGAGAAAPPDDEPAFSRYRLKMVDIDLRLTAEDVESLCFFLRRSLARPAGVDTFMKLATGLEKVELIGPDNLHLLATSLYLVGRLDLSYEVRNEFCQ